MLRMKVVVSAENEERKKVQEEVETQVVNAHGGLLKMRLHLHDGQSFLLKNPRSGAEETCRVVRTEDRGLDFYHMAFEFARPAPTFWPIVFPPADWTASTVK